MRSAAILPTPGGDGLLMAFAQAGPPPGYCPTLGVLEAPLSQTTFTPPQPSFTLPAPSRAGQVRLQRTPDTRVAALFEDLRVCEGQAAPPRLYFTPSVAELGAPVVLATATATTGRFGGPDLAYHPTRGHLAAVWTEADAGAPSRLWFTELDAAGAPRHAPVVVSGPRGSATRPVLVPWDGDRYLVVWVNDFWSPEPEGIRATVLRCAP